MSNRPPVLEPTATSPSASGPAGALFEGQVGAHYLLTMLAEADPRGLPGVLAERVELQRACDGHPLDDEIVLGTTKAGEPAVLEVQVKRTATFAPADPVVKGRRYAARASAPNARYFARAAPVCPRNCPNLAQDRRGLPGRAPLGPSGRFGGDLRRPHQLREGRQ